MYIATNHSTGITYYIGAPLRGGDNAHYTNCLTTTLTATAYPSGGYNSDAELAAWNPSGGWTNTEMAHLGQTIWHMFDLARNIDVDAEMFNNSN